MTYIVVAGAFIAGVFVGFFLGPRIVRWSLGENEQAVIKKNPPSDGRG